MNNLNSIIMEGNLTRDPMVDTTPSGTPVCYFTVASNRYYKSKEQRHEEVGYFDVEVWSRLAETCSEYLAKGRGVRVVGRLKQDRWVNAEGKNRSRIRIVGEHVEFSSRPRNQSTEKNNEQNAEAGAPQSDSVKEELTASVD